MDKFTIEDLYNTKLTATTKKCAAVLLKRCKMIAKWKKLGEKALEDFKKIYTNKSSASEGEEDKKSLKDKLKSKLKGKKEGRDMVTRAELVQCCDNIYAKADNLFTKAEISGNFYGTIVEKELNSKKASIMVGNRILSEDKKLIKSIQEVAKYYDYLKVYDIKSIILASHTLQNLNLKLNAGLETIIKSYIQLSNSGINEIELFKNNCLSHLPGIRKNATNIINKKKELLESLSKSKSDSKTLLDGIFDNYSSARDCSKAINNSYNELEGNILKIKEKNPDVFNKLKLEDFIKKDDISNFLPEIKKIKEEAIKINGGRTARFDLRSVQSAKNFPTKTISKLLSSIIDFLNGKTPTFSIDNLEIKDKIDKVEKKLEEIKLATYEKNTESTNIEEARKRAEDWFNSQTKSPEIKIDLTEENATEHNHQKIKSNIESQLGDIANIESTLKKISDKAKEDKVYHLALIEKMSSDLSEAINKLKGEFDTTFKACNDLVKQLGGSKLKRALGRIQPITGAIATIGCFAGFAMSSICPVVGWAIFGVCVAAFAVNLGVAIYRAVDDLHSRHKKKSKAI